jgi:hypothetical protein
VGGALSRDGSLTVNGAETRLSLIPGDDNFPPLYWLNSLTLGSGLYVTQPWGGYFDNGKGHITLDDDSPYTGKLVIISSHGVHGDMNGDGIVDVSDIAKIINIIGTKARKAESPVE